MLALIALPVVTLVVVWAGGLHIWWSPHAEGFSDRQVMPKFENVRFAEVLAVLRPGVAQHFSSPEVADNEVNFTISEMMKERDVLFWIAFSSQTVIVKDANGIHVEGIFWLERMYQRLDGYLRLYCKVKLWPTRASMQ